LVEAFLLPPLSGRTERDEAVGGDVRVIHPVLARHALGTLIGVMRRVESPSSPPQQSGSQLKPGATDIGTAGKPTPTLKVSSWGEVEIRFLSDERVEIRVGSGLQNRNYGEFGLRTAGTDGRIWHG
jgi:hypothetical protein